MISHFLRDETGATAIEYAIIAALISLGIISALYGVRDALNNGFATVSNGFHS